jgi:branched-chain amino acid transport system substrate-binding protein
MRMQLMVQALVQAINKVGTIDSIAVAAQLERASVTFGSQTGAMRAMDHQFQQPLVVGLMDKVGAPGVKFDVEGSGYGFRVIKTITAAQAEQASSCQMQRP